MAKPDGGLIQETNRQYYEGAQSFVADGTNNIFTANFNTDLVFGNFDPTEVNYGLNNFKLFTSFIWVFKCIFIFSWIWEFSFINYFMLYFERL